MILNHMNSLYFKQFLMLLSELKKQINELCPHQPKDFKLFVTYRCPKQNRSFCTSWFDKKPWSTPSIENKHYFVFIIYVLLIIIIEAMIVFGPKLDLRSILVPKVTTSQTSSNEYTPPLVPNQNLQVANLLWAEIIGLWYSKG